MANIAAPGVGVTLSVAGLVILLMRASLYGDAWHIVSSIVYGASLVVSYAAFTMYHVFKFHKRWGKLFKIIDHSAIYVLIAGTYTPFTLVYLRGEWGWTLFGSVWALTLGGILFKVFFVHRFKVLAPLTYLFMGWLIVFAARPAVERIPQGALYLLLVGGLFYSSGLLFYAWKRLLFHHAIWHLFVLSGSISHFLAVFYFVIP
ncbi:MAG: PAQR family membrane homeostasis protein TrhA [Deferrisomatales bacterium]